MAFSANKACQPVYNAIHNAIRSLPNSQAIQVLEEIADHASAMAEGIREESTDEEDE